MKHVSSLKTIALGVSLLAGQHAFAQIVPFTSGNVVVARVGAVGAAPITVDAREVFLDEYTPTGTLVQSVPMPTAVSGANRAFTTAATAALELSMTRSADGRYLVLTGYDAVPGTTNVAGTQTTSNVRVAGRVAANGTIDTSTTLGDAFTGVNIRGAASVDGTSFYVVGGGGGGVRYVPLGNPSTATGGVGVNLAPLDIRSVAVAGGNLYISSAANGVTGISQIGSGLPTTTGQTNTLVTGSNSTSPYGFYAADLSPAVPGIDVLYVVEATASTGGIQKYSLVGGTWTFNGTIAGLASLRQLTGRMANGTVSLFATSSTSLYAVADNAGYNAPPSTAIVPVAVATAGTNTPFRGVALAPVQTALATLPTQVLPGLAVFPNPTTDRLTVALPAAGPATVALRDLTGRLVLAPAALGADQQVALPAALARGMYLLEVRQGAAFAVRRIEKN